MILLNTNKHTNKNLEKYAATHQNMQKICKNPKYAQNIF